MKIRKLFEQDKSQVKKGRKRITILCNDSGGELEKFLNWWKAMGDIGHSAVVHCDVEQKSDMVKIFCDGDGADRTESITVQMLEEK